MSMLRGRESNHGLGDYANCFSNYLECRTVSLSR